MKKQHLFTLDVDLVKELHRKIGRGYRSQFVEQAIRTRLSKEENFNLRDVNTRQLMASLLASLEGRKDAAAEMIRVFLREELT